MEEGEILEEESLGGHDGKTFIFETPVHTEFEVEFGVEMSDSADENMMPECFGIIILLIVCYYIII